MKKKKTKKIGLIILGSLLGAITIGGILGGIFVGYNKPKQNENIQNQPINQNENASSQINDEKPIENKEPIVPVDKTRLDSLKTKVGSLQDDEIKVIWTNHLDSINDNNEVLKFEVVLEKYQDLENKLEPIVFQLNHFNRNEVLRTKPLVRLKEFKKEWKSYENDVNKFNTLEDDVVIKEDNAHSKQWKQLKNTIDLMQPLRFIYTEPMFAFIENKLSVLEENNPENNEVLEKLNFLLNQIHEDVPQSIELDNETIEWKINKYHTFVGATYGQRLFDMKKEYENYIHFFEPKNQLYEWSPYADHWFRGDFVENFKTIMKTGMDRKDPYVDAYVSPRGGEGIPTKELRQKTHYAKVITDYLTTILFQYHNNYRDKTHIKTEYVSPQIEWGYLLNDSNNGFFWLLDDNVNFNMYFMQRMYFDKDDQLESFWKTIYFNKDQDVGWLKSKSWRYNNAIDYFLDRVSKVNESITNINSLSTLTNNQIVWKQLLLMIQLISKYPRHAFYENESLKQIYQTTFSKLESFDYASFINKENLSNDEKDQLLTQLGTYDFDQIIQQLKPNVLELRDSYINYHNNFFKINFFENDPNKEYSLDENKQLQYPTYLIFDNELMEFIKEFDEPLFLQIKKTYDYKSYVLLKKWFELEPSTRNQYLNEFNENIKVLNQMLEKYKVNENIIFNHNQITYTQKPPRYLIGEKIKNDLRLQKIKELFGENDWRKYLLVHYIWIDIKDFNGMSDDEIRDYLSETNLEQETRGHWKIVKSFFE